MDPTLLMALFGAGSEMASGIGGHILASADRRKAEEILEDGLAEYGRLSLPELAKVTAEVGPSAYDNIRVDPRYRDAQHALLGRLEQASREGLTFEDMMAQEQALRSSARQESAGRQRIAQEMAARGTLDSGAQLAMQLANQQASAEGNRDISMQTAANAQKRMYQAMMDRGQFAGNLRNQEFGEQERIAQARDAVARYNASARQQAAQWHYGQQAQLAANKLNAVGQRSGMYSGKAQNTANTAGAIGGAANQGFNMAGQYMQKQQGQDGYRLGQEEERYGPGPLSGAARGYY